MSKSPEELYKERDERVGKALGLGEPDRVPVPGIFCSTFPARYAGFTCHEVMYDYEKARKAVVKATVDFGWDGVCYISGMEGFIFSLAFIEKCPDITPFIRFVTGPVHDILGEKYGRFPGRELPEDIPYQYIGGEYMKVEEYDMLIEDPVNFVAEVILPRICKNLEKPGSATAMGALMKTGLESGKFATSLLLPTSNLAAELKKLGFPSPFTSAGATYAPLDFISDFLRDMKNVLLDLYRVPSKVKQACEALTAPVIKVGKVTAQLLGLPLIFLPLHLNDTRILSPKLYHEFYWPTLKRVIHELTNAGLHVTVFYEGRHDAHLKTILELPKGTAAWFEKTDLRKAKEVIGGHACIMGGPPASLLIGGTPAKIEEYMKELLEDLKPGGGFIVNPGGASGIPNEAKPENVKAMIEAVMKYGVY